MEIPDQPKELLPFLLPPFPLVSSSPLFPAASLAPTPSNYRVNPLQGLWKSRRRCEGVCAGKGMCASVCVFTPLFPKLAG